MRATPEFWHGLKIFLIVVLLLWLFLWNGFSIEIGQKDSGFHMQFQTYPLKRFFK